MNSKFTVNTPISESESNIVWISRRFFGEICLFSIPIHSELNIIHTILSYILKLHALWSYFRMIRVK